MILRYRNHSFEFELKNGTSFSGYFQLSELEKTLLAKLEAEEPEDWYLNSNGERLSSDELFSLSPWSVETTAGVVKLLNRLMNLTTGEASFSTQETYVGEFLSDYLRACQERG